MNQKALKELLYYDKKTGVFTWKIDGRVAEVNANNQINVLGKSYSAQRLAFLYVNGEFPEYQARHVNGKMFDNRWDNIFEVMPNECDRCKREANMPDLPGVFSNGYCWEAETETGERIGYFANKKEALQAKMKDDFNNGTGYYEPKRTYRAV